MNKSSGTALKVSNFFAKLFTYGFCIFLAAILLLVVFYFPNIDFELKKSFVKYNIFILIGALVISAAFILLNSKFPNLLRFFNKWNWKKFLLIASVVLFIFQMAIFVNKIFIAGWDVQKLYFRSEFDELYFSQYPNNLFLKGLFIKISSLFQLTGISGLFMDVSTKVFPWSNIANNLSESTSAEYCTYFFAIVINCILVVMSIVLISSIIKKYRWQKTAVIVYFFSAIFLGLMPWILVPYSDIFTEFNTILILYLIICVKKRIKWPAVIFIAIIAYNVKPTSLFCIIAILITDIIYLNKRKLQKIDWKQILKTTCLCVLSGAIALAFVFYCKSTTNINIDKNKEYGATHFMMMGLNQESDGFYNDHDIEISSSCPDEESRKEKNIDEIQNRLEHMGIAGTTKLLIKKVTGNYSDGTFMWEMDAGPGFSVLDVTNNHIVDNIYKSYGPVAQILWFITIIGCCMNIFNRKIRKPVLICSITLLMLTLFLTTFECGARYQIQYLGYFIVLSSIGWLNIFDIIKKKIK